MPWPAVRYIELSAAGKSHPNEVIHLRQVEVFDSSGTNQALSTNRATAWMGSMHGSVATADKLIDGDMDSGSNHTAHGGDSTTRITLAQPTDVYALAIHNVTWNAQYKSSERLVGSVVKLLSEDKSIVWTHTFSKAEDPSLFKYDGPETSPFAKRFGKPEIAIDIGDAEGAGSTDTLAGRLTDDGHCAVLPPLSGCFDDETNPLVSIDVAVTSQPDDHAALVYSAKQWVRRDATKAAIAAVPGITTDGAMAIWCYTSESTLYVKLNTVLRLEDRMTIKPYFPFLRLLLTALKAIREGKSGEQMRVVNRGVPRDLLAEHPDVYGLGESFVWWGFSSCTSNIGVLSNPLFLGDEGDRTIFQVFSRFGAVVSSFSAITSEAEVLLPAGTALRITGILPKDKSGLTIITCEDDPDAPPLIN